MPGSRSQFPTRTSKRPCVQGYTCDFPNVWQTNIVLSVR